MLSSLLTKPHALWWLGGYISYGLYTQSIQNFSRAMGRTARRMTPQRESGPMPLGVTGFMHSATSQTLNFAQRSNHQELTGWKQRFSPKGRGAPPTQFLLDHSHTQPGPFSEACANSPGEADPRCEYT